LIPIRSLDTASLEFHEKQNPIRQEHAVHSEATSPEVEFQDYVPNGFTGRCEKRAVESVDLVTQVLLENIDTRLPLAVLVLFNHQILHSGSTSE